LNVSESFERNRYKTADLCPNTRQEIWHEAICAVHFGFSYDAHNWGLFSADLFECRNPEFQLVRSHAQAATGRRRQCHINADGKDIFTFMAPLCGSVIIEQNGHSTEYRPGELAMFDVGKPFLYTHDKAFSADFFKVPRKALDSRIPYIESVSNRPLDCSGNLTTTTIEYFHTIAGGLGAMGPLEHATASRHLFDLLSLIMEARADCKPLGSSARTSLLASMKVHVSNHIDDPGLTTSSIAARFGCTPRYVQLIFKSAGTTTSRYIRLQRLKYARELLRSPLFAGTSITEVAFKTGFSSSSYFGAAFKSQYGMTPTGYHKLNAA